MTEATIICPNCRTEIPLTESLAAPMLAATRRQFEQQLAQKDEDIAKREQGLRDKEKQLADAKRTLNEQVADQVAGQLQAERAHVVAEEGKKAKLASAAELEAKVRELGELQEVLKIRDEKLAEAQKAQAELIRKQRNLGYFEQEVQKLDAWADDLKLGLEQQIKEVRRTAAISPTLEEKLAHQKHQRELEGTRGKLRRDLFARQDEVEAQRNDLITQLEAQLQQVREQTLFTIE